MNRMRQRADRPVQKLTKKAVQDSPLLAALARRRVVEQRLAAIKPKNRTSTQA